MHLLNETELCWSVFCRTRRLLYKGPSVDDVREISVAEESVSQSTTASLPQVKARPRTTPGRGGHASLQMCGTRPRSEAFLCAVLPRSRAPSGGRGPAYRLSKNSQEFVQHHRNRCLTNETRPHLTLVFLLTFLSLNSVILGQTQDLCPNTSGTKVPQQQLLSWRPPNQIPSPPVYHILAPVMAVPHLFRIISNSGMRPAHFLQTNVDEVKHEKAASGFFFFGKTTYCVQSEDNKERLFSVLTWITVWFMSCCIFENHFFLIQRKN